MIQIITRPLHLVVFSVKPLIGTLFKEKDALCSSDMQFGFKEGLSTTECTFTMLETISYYNFNHTNVYALFLDATKAFDRVHYGKLFKELCK